MKKRTVEIQVLPWDTIEKICSYRTCGVTKYLWYKKGFTFTPKEDKELPKGRKIQVEDKGDYYLWIGKFNHYDRKNKEWKIHKDFVEKDMKKKKINMELTLRDTYIDSGMTFEEFKGVALNSMCSDLNVYCVVGGCSKCLVGDGRRITEEHLEELRIDMGLPKPFVDMGTRRKKETKKVMLGTGIGLLVLGLGIWKYKS